MCNETGCSRLRTLTQWHRGIIPEALGLKREGGIQGEREEAREMETETEPSWRGMPIISSLRG